MIESIRSYIYQNNLARALDEARKNQYTDRIEAVVACIRKCRGTKEQHAVVNHRQEAPYWVVSTKSAQLLNKEGYQTMIAF